MKLIVSPRVAAEILSRKRWWRANRPKAPGRFDEELSEALARIRDSPDSFPVFSERDGRTVRRCLLSKTRCHLYFEVVPSQSAILLLAARGAVQRRPPRLR
jgi:hypothetical protein